MGARPAKNSGHPSIPLRSGPVAQLVEQGTFNPKVAGSIPARPIAKSLQKRQSAPRCETLRGRCAYQGVRKPIDPFGCAYAARVVSQG
jgi:hypothetical protein